MPLQKKDHSPSDLVQATQVTTHSRFRRPGFLFSLVGLLFVLLISGFTAYNRLYQPYQSHLQSTATALYALSATRQSNEEHFTHITATAQSKNNATATTVSQLQDDYTRLTQKTPFLTDTLQKPDIFNWETDSGCSFNNGSYHVSVTQKGYFISCTALNTHFQNFIYQAHMKFLRGDKGGIIFRANSKNSTFYLFQIGQDQSYDIYYYPDKTGTTAQHLTGGQSSLIATNNQQENVLAVLARGKTFHFYLNGTYLTSVEDAARSTGQIGVIADDLHTATEIVYTQVQVWQL
ncbi:family 16 glycoside hydrolase [Tengunoibacter tsumagoiensis]|uniref:3-keto-alpha-glucoside-1,2-lyase/3-keto-2-hydroxy-glucal hydratase domain-containing protein n=1 Tax=Tengunoibacter tsumagoiensis TaxID=2014871 RepID=A0A402A475_9CHLR|nr:hypothetical protein [Tengunoibacter tsumagoiensis]GCE13938.1 hypothetical protein KTT_37970 [Tengunoibacter tsumagoiensis]